MQKSKREDFRLEDELRTSKAKYEESSEDVYRRMMDIKEAEADSVRDLTSFLDSELDYYERCADELRRVKQDWMAGQTPTSSAPRTSDYGVSRRPTTRPRGNTGRSYNNENNENNDRGERWAGRQEMHDREREPTPEPVRMPIRSNRYPAARSVSPEAPRLGLNRAATYGGVDTTSSHQSHYREPPPPRMPERPPMPEISIRKTTAEPPSVGSLRSNLRPTGISRIQTNNQNLRPDVFGDEYDTATSGSPEYDRSESPATSYGSLSRTTSNNALRQTMTQGSIRKAPPPPPPSRSKKPPPPLPAKRDVTY